MSGRAQRRGLWLFGGRLRHKTCPRDVDRRRLAERLVHNAVAFSQAHERIELLFRCIGLQLEGQPDSLESHQDAGLRLERAWPCIPYDVYNVTGHHSTAETYLFSCSSFTAEKRDPLKAGQ